MVFPIRKRSPKGLLWWEDWCCSSSLLRDVLLRPSKPTFPNQLRRRATRYAVVLHIIYLYLFIFFLLILFSYRFTSVPYNMTSLSTVTLVSDEVIAPIRIETITRPVNVHIIPKMRPMIDLGARSPYLSTNISKYGTSH